MQHLRELKQGNEQAQAAIGELVQQIAAAHDSFERQRQAVAGELARLQQEVAQHEQDAGQALPELPEGGCEAAGCTSAACVRQHRRRLCPASSTFCRSITGPGLPALLPLLPRRPRRPGLPGGVGSCHR